MANSKGKAANGASLRPGDFLIMAMPMTALIPAAVKLAVAEKHTQMHPEKQARNLTLNQITYAGLAFRPGREIVLK